MAKALLGYVGGTDPRLLEEARRLRTRVRDLEAQVVRLQDENDTLAAALHEGDLHDGHLLALDPDSRREPALT
jgi:hypothetical protein